MNQPIKQVRRKHKLPSVFCAFPWVRHRGPGVFADVNTPEDQKLVSLYKRLLGDAADVSELDDVSSLVLAVDIPTSILTATGKSGRGFAADCYGWNLYDVNYLLKGTKPSEAAPISEAGFTDEQLVLLAKDDSYLDYIRALEVYDGRSRGYHFPIELEQEIKTMERRMAAKGKLNKLLVGLRDNSPAKTSPSQKVSESLRNEILQFHNYVCIFDGRCRPEFKMHVHHVIPQRLIKRLALPERLFTARENLVCACSGCNIVKSDELTQADVRFYLVQFANPKHPNHPLVKFLERFQQLQQET